MTARRRPKKNAAEPTKKAKPVKETPPTPEEALELDDIASQIWSIKIAVDAGEDREQIWCALNQVERSIRRLGDRVGELLTAREAVA